MKFNRIAIIAILAIFTVILAGSASAFDLGFLTGSDSEPQEVTVGGIDFNIPAGFTENEDYAICGGFPLIINNEIAGTGLRPHEDHDVVIHGINCIKEKVK